MELHKIANSFKYKNTIYGLAKYRMVMSMHFTKEEKQTDKEFETYVAFMFQTFKNKHKDAKITRKGNTISIDSEKEIVVINDNPNQTNWKLIEFIKNSQPFYEMLFDEEVAAYLTENFK